MTTHFSPDAKGWVVRHTHTYEDGRTHNSWWYGPNHGGGGTSGPLDYSVAVFPTKKEALTQARKYDRRVIVERVAEAVAFAISECDRRKASVLAGDRPDRQSIADANDRAKKYLKGEAVAR